MYDAPGFKNVHSGVTYNVHFDFLGQLIDTGSGQVLQQNTWSVIGSALVPMPIETTEAVSLAAHDRILMAYRTQNTESGAPELHVVISRLADQPPLNPNSWGLTARDTSGQPLRFAAAPLVHEIGGRSRSTATVVYTLAPGSNPPQVAHLAINGGLVTLPVHEGN
jgi:hypothetical protein